MLLQVTNLSFGFGQRTLVSDLSFQIPESSFLAIIGHNGSGKSTLIKTLLSRQSFSGEILIKGKDLRAVSKSEVSDLISCLEQKNNLSFDISVIDLVMMGRFRFKNFFSDYNDEDRQEGREALRNLEIEHLEEKDFLSLSGGEQQLVWLAQLTVQNTDIVLLDEPTQQLDLCNRKRVFDQMTFWVKEKKKLVVCVTHDIQNLYEMEGCFINLSEKKPSLGSLNKANLDQHLAILQDKNYRTKALVPEVF